MSNFSRLMMCTSDVDKAPRELLISLLHSHSSAAECAHEAHGEAWQRRYILRPYAGTCWHVVFNGKYRKCFETRKEARDYMHELKATDVKRCTHVTRVQIHPSIRIGGASIGHCENKRLPGLVVCFEHVTKDALALQVRMLMKDYKLATGKRHSMDT